MKDTERTIDVPTEDDENVGDLPKKKIKKKKTKEERDADRKAVFWTLLVVLAITLFFWIWPKMKDFEFGFPGFGGNSFGEEMLETDEPKTEIKNYIEYKL